MTDTPVRPQSPRLLSRIKARPLAVFLAVTLLPFGVASAVAEQCIKAGDPCNPALLCSFEADLAGKVATYQAYLRNSQVTRNAKAKKREGVTYEGKLYEAALAEAKSKHPDATSAVQRRVAADIFNAKLRASLKDKLPKFMQCGIPDVKADESILATWNGMHTSEDCNVYGDTDEGTVLLDDLKQDTTACLEFFERDVGHENVHKSLCNERRGKPPAEDPYDIDHAIEEEIAAYNYSVKRAAADVRALALKCSVDPSLRTRRQRAKDLAKKLGSYQAKGR